MKFQCINTFGKRKTSWVGQIDTIKGVKENCEIEITARGHYYHVIFGSHSYGHYLCIPNWNVGCEMADFSDLFWNTERLAKNLNLLDAITIATAVKEAEKILNS